MAWLGTNSGKVIDLINTDPDQITIEDIALGLSRVSRFNGQINRAYSVAQHSMWVASIVPPEFKLQGLLHDATEAYICDVPTPLKRMLGESYKDVEETVASAIGRAFNLDLVNLSEEVKHADKVMLITEHQILQDVPLNWGSDYDLSLALDADEFLTNPITVCNADQAYKSFMASFNALMVYRS